MSLNNIGGIWVRDKNDIPSYQAFLNKFKNKSQAKNLILLSDNPFQKNNSTSDGRQLSFSDLQSLDKINGHWAIIEFDAETQTINIARDFIGLKPMYYLETKEFFAFSSTITPLLLLPSSKKLSDSAIFDFLTLGLQDQDGHTLYANIRELLPEQAIELHITSGIKSIVSYNRFPYHKPTKSPDIHTLQDISSILEKETLKCNGEGSIHALLSGGVDSSIINSILGSHSPNKHNAYTIGFPSKSYDESFAASTFLQKYPSIHSTIITPSGKEFYNDLELLHKVIELPTLSAGSYLQFRLMKAVRDNGGQEILDGTGADALFGGHLHYRYQLMVDHIKALKLNDFLHSLSKGSVSRDVKSLIKYQLKNTYRRWMPRTIKLSAQKRFYSEWNLINKSFFLEHHTRLSHEMKPPGSLNALLYKDLLGGGARKLLRFPERCARHFNIELRCPFVSSPKLIELMLSIDAKYKFQGQTSKTLLRQAFKQKIPEQIYLAKGKKGLVSPNNEWVEENKDGLKSYFYSERMKPYLNQTWMDKNLDLFLSRAQAAENYRDFKFVSFAVWMKAFDLT